MSSVLEKFFADAEAKLSTIADRLAAGDETVSADEISTALREANVSPDSLEAMIDARQDVLEAAQWDAEADRLGPEIALLKEAFAAARREHSEFVTMAQEKSTETALAIITADRELRFKVSQQNKLRQKAIAGRRAIDKARAEHCPVVRSLLKRVVAGEDVTGAEITAAGIPAHDFSHLVAQYRVRQMQPPR